MVKFANAGFRDFSVIEVVDFDSGIDA